MTKVLLLGGALLFLSVFVVGCAQVEQETILGKAFATTHSAREAAAGNTAHTSLSPRLYFPAVSFDPSKLYYEPASKKLCYDDAFGAVCESKPMRCKHDAKTKSYSCKLQASLSDYFFPYRNLVFTPQGGKLYLCLPCLIGGINPTISRTCGNNVIESGEECDDGNQLNGDGCTFDCKSQTCGNNIVELPYEMCDDGNTASGDGCSNRCVSECTINAPAFGVGATSASYHCPAICGNNVLERGEVCDGGPSCSEECTLLEPRECYACVEGVCGSATVLGDSCGILYDSVDTCEASCGPGPTIVSVPPTATDADLCATPDPFDLPEGTRFRDYEDARHISVCEPDDSADCTGDGDCARYIICGRDGTTTVNVEPCPEGVACENGACIEDPRWGSTCFDTDGGADRDIFGAAIIFDETGSESDALSRVDVCLGRRSVAETICAGDETAYTYLECDWPGQICENGVCIIGSIECEDSDGGINLDEAGHINITVSTIEGEHESRYDYCSFDQRHQGEWYCTIESFQLTTINCDAGEHCENATCVPGDPLPITCEDSDGGDNIYLRGEAALRRSDGASQPHFDDACYPGTNDVEELVCASDSSSIVFLRQTCPEGFHCQDGACVEGEEEECSRTEATDTAAGYVTDSDGVIQGDICEGDILHVFRCNAETGLPEVAESIVCDSGCSDGLCN